MKKGYVALALTLVIALCFALPAVGASPSSLAQALGLAKKANKRAKKASRQATAASHQADVAQSTAATAQSTANGATTRARAAQAGVAQAQSAANSAASAAAAARTSAREVHRDGSVSLPTSTPTTVATMSNVQPGAYVIMAKTDIFAGGSFASGIVQCTASAGSDSDFANTKLGGGGAPNDTNSVFEATLQANLVHTFTNPGSITFSCTNNQNNNGAATAQQTKIIAIRVGEITSATAVSG